MESTCFFCNNIAKGESAFISCPSPEGRYELREIFVCIECQEAVAEGEVLSKCLSCGAYGHEKDGEKASLDLLRSYNPQIVDDIETELSKISAELGEEVGLLPAHIICCCSNPKCTGVANVNFFKSLCEHEFKKREEGRGPEKDFSHMSREELIAKIRKLEAREITFKTLLARITRDQTPHYLLTWEDLEKYLEGYGADMESMREIEESYQKMYSRWCKWWWNLLPS